MKREAAKASLQAVTTGHILTPNDLFDWATEHISNVKFFYISKEVAANVKQQEARFLNAKTVAGTRRHHSYVPCQDCKKMLVKRVSGNDPLFEAVVFLDDDSNPDSTDLNVELKDCEIGRYIACSYDAKWWIGLIRETDEAHDDVQFAFMHPHGPAISFHWPACEDVCYVPVQCMLRIIKHLTHQMEGSTTLTVGQGSFGKAPLNTVWTCDFNAMFWISQLWSPFLRLPYWSKLMENC